MDEPLSVAQLPPHRYREVWRLFGPVPPPRNRTSTLSDISGLFDDRKNHGSPWFNTLVEAERWLNEQGEAQLGLENIDRPDTKWMFENFFNFDVKAVKDRQPLV